MLQLVAFAQKALFDGPIGLGDRLANTLLSQIPMTEQSLQLFQASIEKPCRDFENRLSALGLQLKCRVLSYAFDVPVNQQQRGDAYSLLDVVQQLPGSFAETRQDAR